MNRQLTQFKNELYSYLTEITRSKNNFFVQNIEKEIKFFLESKEIKFEKHQNIISFKKENLFFKISSIQNNFNLLFFSQQLYIFSNIHTDINFITQLQWNQINHTNLPFLFQNFNSFYYFEWQDEEEDKKLIDPHIIYKLFQDLNNAYSRYFIKDLTLNDIYYSKTYNRFIIKDFKTFIPLNIPGFKSLNISQNLEFIPKNILFNKCCFKNNEKELTYNEMIDLSTDKSQLQYYFFQGELNAY